MTTLAIKVDSQLDWEDNQWEALAAFCRTNPTAQIHVHEGRSSQPQHIVDLAFEYHWLTGRPNLFLASQDFRTSSPCVFTMPDNFRLRFGYGSVDMAVLCGDFIETDHIPGSFADELCNDYGRLVAFARAFVEVGF